MEEMQKRWVGLNREEKHKKLEKAIEDTRDPIELEGLRNCALREGFTELAQTAANKTFTEPEKWEGWGERSLISQAI